MGIIRLDGATLPWSAMRAALRGAVQVALAPRAKQQIARARRVVERAAAGEDAVYGINTGFGIFARKKISREHLRELQHNLVRSHAAGMGALLPDNIVRTMMLLKLHTLALGYSGVRVPLAEALAAWISADALPCVPAQGSVGASGDLAPLGHMALALIGEGEVRYQGKIFAARTLAKKLHLPIVTLAEKEGLALLNGTQAMLALLCAAIERTRNLLCHADCAGALTIEGMFGSVVPFHASLHKVRAHPGAVLTAHAFRALLAKSEVVQSHAHCTRVQDPYALRCAPSVHGVARESLWNAARVALREIDSVTDNPIVFADENVLRSGGNFHGAPLAFAADQLAIALTTLSSISERRIEQMINPKAGELSVLGLTKIPGLHSGFMVAHTTAASLVSENKTLAHPASVDTIPTWAGQEDHVSMGMWAARKLLSIVENTEAVIAIELLAAAQAIDLHPRIFTLGAGTRKIFRTIRAHIPAMLIDRYLAPDLTAMHTMLRAETLVTQLTPAMRSLATWNACAV